MQTFTSAQYLMIDIASNFGLDKESWDARLDWFTANEESITELAALTAEGVRPASVARHPLMREAENPALFFAGVQAWAATQRGEAIGYPISLDATASGAQLLAILSGCRDTAALCNVIDTGRREDLYTNVFHLMQKAAVKAGLAAGDVTRGDAKTAVMTSLYGSVAQPRKVFGEGPMLQVFYDTMEAHAGGVWAVNQGFLDLWDPNAESYHWEMPDGFNVVTKVMDDNYETVTFEGVDVIVHTKVNRATEDGRALGANATHSLDGMVVREILRRCNYDLTKLHALLELLARPTTERANERSPNHDLVKHLWELYQRSGFLSARILDLLDEDNMHLVDKARIITLVNTLPNKPFPVLSVHDCFRVHPNYGNDLRRQYNQLLFEIAESNLLTDIVNQITGSDMVVNKGTSFANEILSANYALS